MNQKSSLEYDLKEDDILYFLHIPKTAGMSLTSILENQFEHDSIYHEVIWPKLFKNLPMDFSKYKLFRGHFGFWICKLLPKMPQIITMLRNPREQILSLYYHDLRSLSTDPYSYLKNENEELSKLLKDKRKHGLVNHQTRLLTLDLDVKLLMKTLNLKKKLGPLDLKALAPKPTTNSEKQLVKTANERLGKFKFVGITEKLEESLFLLYYTFGWFPARVVPTKNIAPERSRIEDLPKETVDKVMNGVKLDEKLYQYGKELFESRFSKMVKELKQRYYEKRFAKLTFREMMYEMLEKHFFNRKIGSKIKPKIRINYDFNEKMIGYGWHDREYWPAKGKVVRWSGPETTSVINFPLNKKNDLKIEVEIAAQGAPDILSSLNLDVNGIPIPLKMNTRSNVPKKTLKGKKMPLAKIEGIIPSSELKDEQKLTRFVFKINRTIGTDSIRSDQRDIRKIGLAYEGIKINPIHKQKK